MFLQFLQQSLRIYCYNIPRLLMQLSLVCILKRRPLNCQGLISPAILVYSKCALTFFPFLFRAYVIPADKPQPGTESIKFSKEIQQWVQGQVSKHNFLRGGVVIIDEIPKNAAGKILRRQLRDLARDLSGVTPNPGTNP